MDFEKFPSLTRFSQGWTLTEKLDGSNGQIALTPVTPDNKDQLGNAIGLVHNTLDGVDYKVHAGSRNRWLTLDKDNMGFARWVSQNLSELAKLGTGRHFGEWYGSGIQRTYGLKEKRFALFNSLRWKDNPDTPSCCEVVHTFVHDEYLDNPQEAAKLIMENLGALGSQHVPGFMNPEGIVLFHRKSGIAFKKTFDYDEQGKWAEQKEARNETSV